MGGNVTKLRSICLFLSFFTYSMSWKTTKALHNWTTSMQQFEPQKTSRPYRGSLRADDNCIAYTDWSTEMQSSARKLTYR